MASIIPLTAQAASYDAATHQVVVDFNDLATAAVATAHTVSIPVTASSTADPASIEFLGAEIKGFKGGSITAAHNVTIGDSASATQFLAATNINGNNANVVNRAVAAGGQKALGSEIKFVFAAPAAGKSSSEYTSGRIVARFRINNGM
jgi:hypothetical protein